MKKKFLLAFTVGVLAVCCALGACGGGGGTKIADNTEHFDKITKTLKLSKSYEGKKLMTAGGGGIGKATLVGETTDGDTTNFALEEGGTIAVRYEGVDTPESTAGWEKWGKAASNFTNERLHEAIEIVIESSTGDVPEHDTASGYRYMGYVWYKTAKDDFKLLNLELVENGFSMNKESASTGYYSYFQKAEQFARGIQLRLFSELDDPLFNTAAISLSLKEINENPSSFKENSKVEFYAYISDMYTASKGAITFTIAQYDEATGKSYSLPLFAGYGTTGTMRVGDMYHIVGTLQKYSGNWQVSGVELSDSDSKGDEEKTWRSQLSYYLNFDASHNLYQQELTSNFYGDVTVTSVALDGTKLTFTGTAPKIDGDTPSYTFTVEVPADYNGAIKEGSTLIVSGCYQFEERSGELTVPNYSNIRIK